jgi:hypothetical protein
MTFVGLFVRTLACFALVFSTWNPSGPNYVAWLHGEANAAAKASAGAGLLLIYILFVRIAWLSLGPAGLGGTLAILLTGAVALSELGVVALESEIARDYLALTSVALLLAAGLNWSLVKRRVTGQSDALYQPP